MKRYIEIVYDNSGSMTEFIGKDQKFIIAQKLFEKEILPSIGHEGDQIVLRLLGGECGKGLSFFQDLTERFGNDSKMMLKKIKEIIHSGSTPLFYAVADAVEACKKVKADDYLIFVLTDGDDTCQMRMQDVISQDIIDRYVRNYNVLLVQLGIESTISRNNLTAFTSYLGGQSIQLASADSLGKMRHKMKKALAVSGFSQRILLEYCFDKVPGFLLTWDEIKNYGIDFHQAFLLYHKNYLSWEPEINREVSQLQFAELQFLFGLTFTSGLPDSLVASMLAQLKKPYYYSFDCIYWDFSRARWRYFIKQNHIEQVENPEALDNDLTKEKSIGGALFDTPYIRHSEYFNLNHIYTVEEKRQDLPRFILVPDIAKRDVIITLRDGDQVIFK